jgi:hypothetical protein
MLSWTISVVLSSRNHFKLFPTRMGMGLQPEFTQDIRASFESSPNRSFITPSGGTRSQVEDYSLSIICKVGEDTMDGRADK